MTTFATISTATSDTTTVVRGNIPACSTVMDMGGVEMRRFGWSQPGAESTRACSAPCVWTMPSHPVGKPRRVTSMSVTTVHILTDRKAFSTGVPTSHMPVKDMYECDHCGRDYTDYTLVQKVPIKRSVEGGFRVISSQGVICKECINREGITTVPEKIYFVGIKNDRVAGARLPSVGRGSQYGEYYPRNEIDGKYNDFIDLCEEVFG